MIAIITGGKFSERDAALATAKTVTQSLDRMGKGYKVLDVKNSRWLKELLSIKPVTAVICLPGKFGEDGQIQQILEKQKISYTGSSSKISKLAFDKRRTKKAVQKLGINTPKEYSEPQVLNLKRFPAMVVKPVHEGSSVGVSLVTKKTEFELAINKAKDFDRSIMIEEYIDGRELSCAVTDIFGSLQALPIVEIKPSNSFFDFEAKYVVDKAEEICPANLEEKITKEIQELSLEIHRKLGIRHYCRIDWILKGNTPYFIEVNTIPGMTPTSLINKEIIAAGIDFDLFIGKLIEAAG